MIFPSYSALVSLSNCSKKKNNAKDTVTVETYADGTPVETDENGTPVETETDIDGNVILPV